MDYGKFKYEQKRKASELKKKQTVVEVKEVKFRPKTGQHDFDTKLRHLREFLEDGNKGRVTIMFRGREIVHPEIGQEILKKVAEAISDIGQVEVGARMEGKQMFMIVAPGKAPARRPMVAPGSSPASATPAPPAAATGLATSAPATGSPSPGPQVIRKP
jgi:translation initiation factor IF-3